MLFRSHALSHMVGATYDTHHGLTNAIILPVVLRFNEPDIAARLNPVAHAMNLPDPTFATFYQAICSKLDELEIPKSLAAIGVDDRNTQIMARKSFADPAHDTNPRASTVEQLSDLLAQAITRSRT